MGTLLLALAIGFLAAVGIVYSRLLERTLYTLLVALNSVPKVALAPHGTQDVRFQLPASAFTQFDAEGRIAYENAAVERVLGYAERVCVQDLSNATARFRPPDAAAASTTMHGSAGIENLVLGGLKFNSLTMTIDKSVTDTTVTMAGDMVLPNGAFTTSLDLSVGETNGLRLVGDAPRAGSAVQ